MEWISVKDKLPDEKLEVLLHTIHNSYYIGYYENNMWDSDQVGRLGDNDYVTHWANLEPPKDVK